MRTKSILWIQDDVDVAQMLYLLKLLPYGYSIEHVDRPFIDISNEEYEIVGIILELKNNPSHVLGGLNKFSVPKVIITSSDIDLPDTKGVVILDKETTSIQDFINTIRTLFRIE